MKLTYTGWIISIIKKIGRGILNLIDQYGLRKQEREIIAYLDDYGYPAV